MRRFEVQLSQTAETDIVNIHSYICNELKEPIAAMNLNEKLKIEILGLGYMPERFPLIADERLYKLGIRKISVDNYIIFYLIDDMNDKVFVLRVLFGKRGWMSLL